MSEYLVVREILFLDSEGYISKVFRKFAGPFGSEEKAFCYGCLVDGEDLFEVDGGWYIIELVP